MPKLNDNQVTGIAGEKWFASVLPVTWIPQPPIRDVGVDLLVVICEDGPWNGLEFKVQVKSNREWTIRDGAVVVSGFKVRSLYIEVSLPNMQLQTAEWSSGNPLSQRAATKARNACHKVLSHRYGNHHDAFVILGNVGNAESIPYLINALQWQSPPHEDGSVVCTTHHCISRLRELTGEWYGADYIKWKKWWDETGRKMSPEELAKNVVVNKDRFKRDGNAAEQRGGGDGVPPPHR